MELFFGKILCDLVVASTEIGIPFKIGNCFKYLKLHVALWRVTQIIFFGLDILIPPNLNPQAMKLFDYFMSRTFVSVFNSGRSGSREKHEL